MGSAPLPAPTYVSYVAAAIFSMYFKSSRKIPVEPRISEGGENGREEVLYREVKSARS